tara:strand:- start:294 stop:533 length:240 start_codon:yes stop_codon:yes gene_type:complete
MRSSYQFQRGDYIQVEMPDGNVLKGVALTNLSYGGFASFELGIKFGSGGMQTLILNSNFDKPTLLFSADVARRTGEVDA